MDAAQESKVQRMTEAGNMLHCVEVWKEASQVSSIQRMVEAEKKHPAHVKMYCRYVVIILKEQEN